MELFDWAFFVTIAGWITREVWANISKDNTIKKQANIEHEYYQKRLLFEQKNDFYKDVYERLRMYQGGLSAFVVQSIENTLTTVQEDAMDKHIKILEQSALEEIIEFEQTYTEYELKRINANFDMTVQKILDARRELNNYMSMNKFMLSDEEDVIIRELYELGDRIEKHIKNAEYIFYEKNDMVKYEQLIRHFDYEYSKKCKKLDDLINNFEKQIRVSYFM